MDDGGEGGADGGEDGGGSGEGGVDGLAAANVYVLLIDILRELCVDGLAAANVHFLLVDILGKLCGWAGSIFPDCEAIPYTTKNEGRGND